VNQPNVIDHVAPLGSNPKNTLTDWPSALQAGIHVSDGSLYEAAKPATAEPEIELIEEVGPKDLPFDAPEASTHVRVTYTEGPDRHVSFSPRTYTECDDYREFLVAELGRVYRDGIEIEPGNLADDLNEALEEWTLGRRAA
jgi:hypothetical protein